MKNIEKWRKTMGVLLGVSNSMKDEVNIKELKNRIIRRNSIMYRINNSKRRDLSIVIKNMTLILSSYNFGDYMETLLKKRNRLNIVPLCFLVQMYNEQISVNNDPIIPFELKSFWKMERANELIGDLFKIIWNQKSVLQSIEKISALEKQQNKIRNALELVNSLEILPPENGKTQIHFSELKFTVNTNNVKLDIVPLCKLLVKYYVQIINCMDDLCESFEDIRTKQMIHSLESDMQKFMEKYFTSGINY